MSCWPCPRCGRTNCDIDFCPTCKWEEEEDSQPEERTQGGTDEPTKR